MEIEVGSKENHSDDEKIRESVLLDIKNPLLTIATLILVRNLQLNPFADEMVSIIENIKNAAHTIAMGF